MKKGFTLIELLVIITIMGMLATFLIPNVIEIVERSEKKTFLEDGKAIIRASENYINQNNDSFQEGNCFDIIGSDLEITLSENIQSGQVCYINSKPYLKHLSNGEKCISGSDSNLETYKCGDKAVIFFDGSLLGKSNTPYISIPHFAILVEKNRVINLDLYHHLYTKYDGEDSKYTYNFWVDYNLQHVATKWIDENSNEVADIVQGVSTDKVYRVSEMLKISDAKPTYYGLRSGDYEISIASDSSLQFGYNSLASSNNYATITKNGIWTIKNYGDFYKFFTYDSASLSLDASGGEQTANAIVNLYTASDSSLQQRFNLLKTSEDDVYQIQGIKNGNFCIQADSLVSGSNFKYQPCDSSNPNQLFRLKKYK